MYPLPFPVMRVLGGRDCWRWGEGHPQLLNDFAQWVTRHRRQSKGRVGERRVQFQQVVLPLVPCPSPLSLSVNVTASICPRPHARTPLPLTARFHVPQPESTQNWVRRVRKGRPKEGTQQAPLHCMRGLHGGECFVNARVPPIPYAPVPMHALPAPEHVDHAIRSQSRLIIVFGEGTWQRERMNAWERVRDRSTHSCWPCLPERYVLS